VSRVGYSGGGVWWSLVSAVVVDVVLVEHLPFMSLAWPDGRAWDGDLFFPCRPSDVATPD
jgi:hypothetical protein